MDLKLKPHFSRRRRGVFSIVLAPVGPPIQDSQNEDSALAPSRRLTSYSLQPGVSEKPRGFFAPKFLRGKAVAIKTISFSDIPSKTDELNNGRLHDGLAELIRVAERPLVLAVIGPWGSGKTTLIDHSLGKLVSEYEIIPFNAWSHSKGMPLLKALLVHMNNQKGSRWEGVKEQLKSLAKSPIAAATMRGVGSLAGPIGMIFAEIGAKGIETLASQRADRVRIAALLLSSSNPL